MSGPVTSYNVTQPMGWKEYKSMPHDLRAQYVTFLSHDMKATDGMAAQMLGVSNASYRNERVQFGVINAYADRSRPSTDTVKAWREWLRRDLGPAETAVEEPAPAESKPEKKYITVEEPDIYGISVRGRGTMTAILATLAKLETFAPDAKITFTFDAKQEADNG